MREERKKENQGKQKLFFYINKTDLIRKKKLKLIIIIRHEVYEMLHIAIGIEKVNKNYYEQLYANEFENLGEMDKY